MSQKKTWRAPVKYLPDRSGILQGAKYVWHQVVDNECPADIQLSQTSGSRAVIPWITDAANIYRQGEQFFKCILGGYSANLNKKIPPLQHPFMPGLFATDILSVKEISFDTLNSLITQGRNDATAAWFAQFQAAKVVVVYQSLAYTVNRPALAGGYGFVKPSYSQNWMSVEIKSSNTYVNNPVGWYSYNAGTFTGVPASLGTMELRPEKLIFITIHSVPDRRVFVPIGAPGSANPLQNIEMLTDAYQGTINKFKLLGRDGGTLLLNSIETIPFTNWLGERYNDVRLNYLWNSWGWNFALDPSNTPRGLTNVVTGKPGPFVITDHTPVLAALNPAE